MKSIADLKRLRDESLKKVDLRHGDKDYRVVVGMATCGIAAGARPVLNRFIEEANKHPEASVTITQTGCIGLCVYEPIVEVYDKEGNKTTYVYVDEDKASVIFNKHILNGEKTSEYTIELNKRG